MNKNTKIIISGVILGVGSMFGLMIVFYLAIGFMDWLIGDPLNIINNCIGCK